ncbi:DUF5703 domain-containing protein [Solitalea koreensis]|uniref:Uncharacterized protein n=1 Tax=Solitalea koreensis TaxID=543615 RepID=A0A521DD66_9SPHI|nr:DUF5703 domain-containing protein [Solitalea koreensis]SMO69586.1 hypothetical protein SAMN06265350_106199 [Solitalea koreensis]
MIQKIILTVFLFILAITQVLAQSKTLKDYNIQWTTPGVNSQGSMPIGNGDLGANVWVENNGDLVFYVSKTDAWSEIGRLLKLGKVRFSITPSPFKEQRFLQELDVQNGEIRISYGDTKIKFWVDAHHPVIQTDIQSNKPVQVQVTYESWRKERRQITGEESRSFWGVGENQHTKDCDNVIFQEPDIIVSNNTNKIVAYHHNAYSIFGKNLSIQALDEFSKSSSDPLLNLNYGLLIDAKGLINRSDTVLISQQPSTHFQINVFPLTKKGSIEEWQKELLTKANAMKAISVSKREVAHKAWWKEYWNKSYIFISAKNTKDSVEAENVTRAYILQRFINACGGRGNSPIKFNGSLFTVDTYNRNGSYKALDADFRLWGGCYWWQNTRLPYWSMLVSGDFDLLKPLFKMYMDNLSLRIAATKKYYGHDGAFYPETMNFWGTYADGDYGCNRDSLKDGYVKNPYIRYYWQNGLELSLIMADYYSFTKSSAFAKDTLVPFVSQILSFYDQHWKRGCDGKILFDPAMSLETFHTAVNPLPEIVGIKTVAEKMLQLPVPFTSKEQREQWTKLIQDLPSVPLRIQGKDTLLAPAQEYSNKANSENPELYAVFPYRAYGVGKPGLDMALRTFAARTHKENGGWQQNSIQAAYLGLAEDAKKMIIESFSRRDNYFLFPAFWGPNYDWTPDQDHGCVAMIALQRMLLQYDNDEATLLPAWPREWNVRFKLAGPGKKVYEGEYENGKLLQLKNIKKLSNRTAYVKKRYKNIPFSLDSKK